MLADVLLETHDGLAEMLADVLLETHDLDLRGPAAGTRSCPKK